MHRESAFRPGTSLVGLLLGVALISGCGITQLANNTVEAEPVTVTPSFAPGPLDEYMIRAWGDTDGMTRAEVTAYAERRLMAEQLAIAECMAELGFEYIPGLFGRWGVHSTGGFADDEVQWSSPPGTREYAQSYGFGYAVGHWRDSLVQELIPDPNIALQAMMSESERQAWNDALIGPPPEPGMLWWSPEPDAGCRGSARIATGTLRQPDAFEALEEEINRFRFGTDLANDPRIAELNSDWVSCMIDAGHVVRTNPARVSDDLADEWERSTGICTTCVISGEARQNHATPEWIARFAKREIELAVSDWDCRHKLNFAIVEREINLDLQQQFVDRHGAELEAWAQDREQRRVGQD